MKWCQVGGDIPYIYRQANKAIYDAAMQYQQENRPLAIIAGKEYGSGSSRDWAAKGKFIRVRVVIAYERMF